MPQQFKPYLWLDIDYKIQMVFNLTTAFKFSPVAPETAEDFENERFIIKYKLIRGVNSTNETSFDLINDSHPIKYNQLRHTKVTVQFIFNDRVVGTTTIQPVRELFF